MASPTTDPGSAVLTQRQFAWLAACVASTSAPLLPHVPAALTAFAAILFLWRLWLAWSGAKQPPRLIVLALVIAAMVGVAYSYKNVFGREPGTALLLAFLTLKLMELHAPRDGLTVIFLCYFLQLALFFDNQSPAMAIYMAANLVLITAALMNLQRPDSLRPSLRYAGLLVAQAAPFMLVFFVLFPRVEGPLWGMPRDAYSGLTGLSETMTPGSISLLSQSGALAFRAQFEGAVPPPWQLYWRGPVLSRFDGRSWHIQRHSSGTTLPYAPEGDSVAYTITLEPHNKTWLFALDYPGTLPPDSIIARDYELLSKLPVRTRLRYDVRSHPSLAPGADEGIGALRLARMLPPGGNPRARELAQSWRQRFSDDADIMRTALARFNRLSFVYTLTPPLLGEDSVDEFLFDTRRGFCEHYAGAFVFLMRAAGVPARVVTGYQGGERNPVDGIVYVRQSDAHAWAEVWLTGRGWVRVDPTAAVAPSRVESGVAAALPLGEPLPFLVRADFDWLRGLRFQWEALSNRWDQWVLGYNQERQREVLTRLGMKRPDWQSMTAVLSALCGLLLLGLTAWTLRQRRRADPVQRAWTRLSRKLAPVGLARQPQEGPLDYARRVAGARPGIAAQVRDIAELYAMLRYGPAADESSVRRLEARIASLPV